MQRGRKSADALAVVTNIPGQRRSPPDDFGEAEAAEWRAVVGRMPADWFTDENISLLRDYCRNAAFADRVGRELLAVPLSSDEVDALSKLFDRHVGRGVSLATKMRLTQQSRYDEKKAHTAVKNAPTEKPWERKTG